MAWPAANPTPIASRGHGAGQYELSIRVTPAERERYVELGGSAEMPVGTLVAAVHRDVRQGQPGPLFVMEKRAQGWSYLALDARGFPREHGVLSLCERCHRESPSGGLFGLPRAAGPAD